MSKADVTSEMLWKALLLNVFADLRKSFSEKLFLKALAVQMAWAL